MKYTVTLNGKKYEVEVTETEAAITGVTDVTYTTPAPVPASAPAAAPVPAPAAVSAAGPVGGVKVLSPMPGTVLSVRCAIGDAVKAGQVLFILEAMKMENEIVAPADGTVRQILAAKGQSVDTDQLLAVL